MTAAQPVEEYVATRRIGQATVTLVNDGVFDAIPLIPWPQDAASRAASRLTHLAGG